LTEGKKQPANLTETKKLYYEDNFANLPELTIAWPSVYSYHEDSYALEVSQDILQMGKMPPFIRSW
jgi:zinc protease